MNTPIISVIVPVYKAESYLHRCIDSILSQTFTDLEVLLIDDGSPDRSGEVCDEYAKKDQRIRVFHKENGGVSSARNTGLDHAKGEWITFVDSDDWISSNMYKDMVEAVVKCPGVEHIVQGYRKGNRVVSFEDGNIDMASTFRLLNETSGCCCGYIWHRLFLRSLIGELRFDESMSFAEDGVFWFNYVAKIKNVQFISSCGYNYIIDGIGPSLTRRFVDEEIIEHVIRQFQKAFSLIKSCNSDKRLHDYLDAFISKKVIQYAYRGIHYPDKSRNEKYFNDFLSFVKDNGVVKTTDGLNIHERLLMNTFLSGCMTLFKMEYRIRSRWNAVLEKFGKKVKLKK